MIIQTKQFFVDNITNSDYDEIVTLYNSNIEFLEKHLSLSHISRNWLETEIESMKEMDFITYKIVDCITGKILGVFDFKSDIQAYLSILIIHKDYKGKGIGSLFLEEFFTYLKSKGTESIRIDVVTEYNQKVINFWEKHGFKINKEIKLEWNNNILPAITMIKSI